MVFDAFLIDVNGVFDGGGLGGEHMGAGNIVVHHVGMQAGFVANGNSAHISDGWKPLNRFSFFCANAIIHGNTMAVKEKQRRSLSCRYLAAAGLNVDRIAAGRNRDRHKCEQNGHHFHRRMLSFNLAAQIHFPVNFVLTGNSVVVIIARPSVEPRA